MGCNHEDDTVGDETYVRAADVHAALDKMTNDNLANSKKPDVDANAELFYAILDLEEEMKGLDDE